MMKWFRTESELSVWSPNFRYPFDFDSFKEDMKLIELNSFSLVSEQEELMAFGQYYRRLNRCHLGRLAVSPNHRGKGIVSVLMEQLSEHGMQKLEVTGSSLFVLQYNLSAIRAYEKSGFKVEPYPEQNPLPDCLYMIRE